MTKTSWLQSNWRKALSRTGKRRERTKINERCIQGDETKNSLLHGKVWKPVDTSSMGQRKGERMHINIERSTGSNARIRKMNRIWCRECYTRGRKAGRYFEGNLGQSEETHREGDGVEQERFLQEERTAKRITQKATRT